MSVKDTAEYRARDVAEGIRAFMSGSERGADEESVTLTVGHLRQQAEMIEELLRVLDERSYLSLRCHCTAPLAIRVDTIDHGLLAGWKCQSCGQTLMLSDIARASEALRRDPCLPAVDRDLAWFKANGCQGWVDAYARSEKKQSADRAE
jgi:hypothetical protein